MSTTEPNFKFLAIIFWFKHSLFYFEHRSKRQIKADIKECPNCEKLYATNQQLKVALKKATTLSTANTIRTSNPAKPATDRILNFVHSELFMIPSPRLMALMITSVLVVLWAYIPYPDDRHFRQLHNHPFHQTPYCKDGSRPHFEGHWKCVNGRVESGSWVLMVSLPRYYLLYGTILWTTMCGIAGSRCGFDILLL